ncbi:rhombosortase [Alteromonas facilis]|uniref:rhombosortase n=1 Tax=Alteromonas facilis TaxID=2048004 RepID=UPI000C292FC7|nr:rhombosortase [Alteromonas facilis]
MNRLSFPTAFRLWIVPLFIGLAAVIGWLFDPAASKLFALNYEHVRNGEIYRMLSGHLMHTNEWHLLLNLAGLVLLWALHGDYYTPKRLIIVWVGISLLTSVGLVIVDPDMTYVGLSGALHGLFAWGACLDIRNKDKTGWLLLLGLFIKIGFEQFGGDTSDIAALIDASVAVNAHAFGAFAGVIFGLFYALKKSPQ